MSISIKRIRNLLIALALSGCARATEPDHVVDVSIVPSSDVVHLGDFIDLTVTLTNRGTRAVTIHPPPCQGVHGVFIVTDRDGDVVGPGEMFCTLVGRPPTRLAPGEQVVFQGHWDGDSQRSSISGPRTYLDPGEYQVQGQITIVSGRVLSAPVSVRVVE